MFAQILSNYEPVEGLEVMMKNQARESVLGRGKMLLYFSSKRTLLLTKVLHIHGIWKNLVSVDKLNKVVLCQVIKSDHIVISRNNDYLGRVYSDEGMFKLSFVSGKFINEHVKRPVLFNVFKFVAW